MSEQSKSDRRAIAATDLRSPLAGIESMISLLAETRSQTDQDALIAGLKSAASHLRQVAAGMMGDKASDRAQTVLADVLRPFVTSLAARSRAAGVSFSHRVDDSCSELIVGDRVAVRQMLESVADLAVRGGPARVHFTVGEDVSDTSNHRIALALTCHVADAEPASTLVATTLAPVKTLVRRLGGVCHADREAGSATLSIAFPAAGRRVSAPAPLQPPGGSDAPLLIVDSDSSSRAMVSKVLGHLGRDCADVATAAEALAVMQDRIFSAVLVDLDEGCDLIAAMRSQGMGLPVIAVCERLLPETRRQARDAGVTWVVEKPVTIHDLRQALIATGLRDPMLRQVQAA